jgi:phage baseplate assembly protein W
MATISKKFVDLNPNFEKNPLSGDLPLLKNEAAIKQSLKNIILTIRGEKPFRPFYGSSADVALFENFNPLAEDMLSSAISDAIEAYESRVVVDSIDVDASVDSNSISVLLVFTIVGIPLNPQSLNLILERV